jgi:CheY-like chemotaxis protein
MMPEMDGLELMRILRADDRYFRIPIIALTAKAMKEDRIICLEAGASDYLTKPIDVNRLLAMLRIWLYR